MPGLAAATALDTVICVLTRDNSGSLMPIEHGNWNGMGGGVEVGGGGGGRRLQGLSWACRQVYVVLNNITERKPFRPR